MISHWSEFNASAYRERGKANLSSSEGGREEALLTFSLEQFFVASHVAARNCFRNLADARDDTIME